MTGSPRVVARMAGVCWLMTIVTGAAALFFFGPAGTSLNVLATAFYAAATVLVYGLLSPVSKGLSALAAFFSFVGCGYSLLRSFHLVSPPINPLVFFGLHCLLVGYLIVRSRYLPRLVGALVAIGGLGWLSFVSPELAAKLTPYNLFPGIVGESVLSAWLITMGVNVSKWEGVAHAAKR